MRYITVDNLSFYYDKEPVLEHIHYFLDSGEFVTLTGENGAAKTTLIKASLGILQPKHGEVKISKTNVRGKKLRIAYLPQQIASFNAGFPSTVYEFVKSGRYPRKGWFRRLNEHDEEDGEESKLDDESPKCEYAWSDLVLRVEHCQCVEVGRDQQCDDPWAWRE